MKYGGPGKSDLLQRSRRGGFPHPALTGPGKTAEGGGCADGRFAEDRGPGCAARIHRGGGEHRPGIAVHDVAILRFKATGGRIEADRPAVREKYRTEESGGDGAPDEVRGQTAVASVVFVRRLAPIGDFMGPGESPETTAVGGHPQRAVGFLELVVNVANVERLADLAPTFRSVFDHGQSPLPAKIVAVGQKLGTGEGVGAVGAGIGEQGERVIVIETGKAAAVGHEEFAVHGFQAKDIANTLGDSGEAGPRGVARIPGLQLIDAVERAQVHQSLVPAPDIGRAGGGTVAGVEDTDRTCEVEPGGAGIEAQPQSPFAILVQTENDVVGQSGGAVEDPHSGVVGRNEDQALAAGGEGKAAVGQAMAVVEARGADQLIQRAFLPAQTAGGGIDDEDAGKAHGPTLAAVLGAEGHDHPITLEFVRDADGHKFVLLQPPEAGPAAVDVELSIDEIETAPAADLVGPEPHLALLPAHDTPGGREVGRALVLDDRKRSPAGFEPGRQVRHQ